MNQKLTYIGLMLYSLCYAVMFGTWAGLVFNKVPGAEQFITYIQIALGTLSGHVLTLLGQREPAADIRAQAGQGGFARIGPMIALAIGAAAMFAMSGCATTGGAPESPQQVAARVCPALQITGQNLLALDGLDEPARSAILDAKPVVDAVCAAGVVDATNLRSLSETALPVLVKVINTAPLLPDQKARLMVSLTVAQIGIAGVLQAAGQVAAP